MNFLNNSLEVTGAGVGAGTGQSGNQIGAQGKVTRGSRGKTT